MLGPTVKDFTDGAALGISFGTSLSEGSTQGALGLKHGGHEKVLDRASILKAPDKCKFKEEGNWIVLTTDHGDLYYPRPTNLVKVDKDEFEKGETICSAYNTISPINALNSFIKLIKAIGSNGKRYYEKDNILVSECFAYEDGTITYKENKNGEIEVFIGKRQYYYNPECIYVFPNGSQVKKFDKICNGVIDMNLVTKQLGTNINDTYSIFRKQYYLICDKGFVKSGITSRDSLQEELMEVLFAGLININYDPDKDKIDNVEFLTTKTSIANKETFFTALSYGDAGHVVKKALKGETNITSDIMTDTVLGLLINNKLDNN